MQPPGMASTWNVFRVVYPQNGEVSGVIVRGITTVISWC